MSTRTTAVFVGTIVCFSGLLAFRAVPVAAVGDPVACIQEGGIWAPTYPAPASAGESRRGGFGGSCLAGSVAGGQEGAPWPPPECPTNTDVYPLPRRPREGQQLPKPPLVGTIGDPLPPLAWCPDADKVGRAASPSTAQGATSTTLGDCISRVSRLSLQISGPAAANVSDISSAFRLNITNIGAGTALRGYVVTVTLNWGGAVLTRLMGYDVWPRQTLTYPLEGPHRQCLLEREITNSALIPKCETC
jgi:hypothetical protein